MVDDLADDQMQVPYLPTVNPFLWEVGHGIWFQEYWVLRHALGGEPLIDDPDHLYDSTYVGHEMRWYLKMPGRSEVKEYGERVRDAVLEKLAGDPSPELRYFALLSIGHEDMHQEAFCYMRQSLGYPAPSWLSGPPSAPEDLLGNPARDVAIPGGRVAIGASRDEPFVLDNEKWAHPVEIEPFAIARAAVTQAQFAEFVEDGGYGRPELWNARGWRWKQSSGCEAPVYWRRADDAWQRRVFDSWRDLEPDLAVSHVSWYEADAWCRWAGDRKSTRLNSSH